VEINSFFQNKIYITVLISEMEIYGTFPFLKLIWKKMNATVLLQSGSMPALKK
jgi:hypothetical protein